MLQIFSRWLAWPGVFQKDSTLSPLSKLFNWNDTQCSAVADISLLILSCWWVAGVFMWLVRLVCLFVILSATMPWTAVTLESDSDIGLWLQIYLLDSSSMLQLCFHSQLPNPENFWVTILDLSGLFLQEKREPGCFCHLACLSYVISLC